MKIIKVSSSAQEISIQVNQKNDKSFTVVDEDDHRNKQINTKNVNKINRIPKTTVVPDEEEK